MNICHAHQQQQMMHVTSSIPWIFLWSSNQVGSYHRLYEAVTLFYYLEYTCRCNFLFYLHQTTGVVSLSRLAMGNFYLVMVSYLFTFPAIFLGLENTNYKSSFIFFMQQKKWTFNKTKIMFIHVHISNCTKATFLLYFWFQYGVMLTENAHTKCA